jgi:LAS superfamily LD-carboxypeptidase LdcB
MYEENRVTVAEFGSLPKNSPLLVKVPRSPKQYLHVLAAQTLTEMSNAAFWDLGIRLLVASGWRPHRWKSYEDYKNTLIKKYGSVSKGKLYLAYNSPHETGLAVDFGCGGLAPVSATIPKQKQTKLFLWLVEHAYKFGWTPYKVEPWHWECKIGIDAYKSGKAEGI